MRSEIYQVVLLLRAEEILCARFACFDGRKMAKAKKTGKSAKKIPAKTVVKARIAKQLKDAVLPRK